MAEDYKERIAPSRISEPRLINVTFFQLVLRRVTYFALNLCSIELLQAKALYDKLGDEAKDFEFDPEVGCEELCQLPLRYRLPCKH
jgi:hypothetical protein